MLNFCSVLALITAHVSSSLYLVFEYMDHDLLGLSSLPGAKFSEPQVLLLRVNALLRQHEDLFPCQKLKNSTF